jgi:hypothetical protein
MIRKIPGMASEERFSVLECGPFKKFRIKDIRESSIVRLFLQFNLNHHALVFDNGNDELIATDTRMLAWADAMNHFDSARFFLHWRQLLIIRRDRPA